jgi:hypothetical protein
MSKEPILVFDLIAKNKFTGLEISTEIRIRDNGRKTIRERVQRAYFTYEIINLIPKYIQK